MPELNGDFKATPSDFFAARLLEFLDLIFIFGVLLTEDLISLVLWSVIILCLVEALVAFK